MPKPATCAVSHENWYNYAMHLALNAYFWNQPHTGSGQYTRQLVYYLNRFVSDLEITLVFPQLPGAPNAEAVPPSVRVETTPLRPGNLGKVLFEQVTFPRVCRRIGADVSHVPYWGAPLQSPVPLVVTVHDIITRLTPEYRRGASARLYQALVTASARGARHVITDSHASKADIVRSLDIPSSQVTPIHLAVGPEYTDKANLLLDMAVTRKYDLPDFYVLYLGGYVLHKNVTTLLLAYTYVAQAMGEEYPLLLAGMKPAKVSPHYPDYDRYIEKLGLGAHVRWLGFVEEADKPVLYRQASAFVFPSRYEGFGLPPLEAMACGAPVVATDVASLSEVVGDAALAVDPDDERGMGGAIIAALVQDNLAAELRQKGLRQARQFSWEKTIQQTVQVYANAVR